jgi:leader peptidase (prepilin peptidase) / N-methyltransferase
MFTAMQIPERLGLRTREFWICVLGGLVLAAGVFSLTDAGTAIATGYLAVFMFLIAVIDARRFIVPDSLSLPATLAGFIATLLYDAEPWDELLSDRLLASAVASAFLYAVRLVHWRWRGSEGLGLGDVKLAAVAGAWLGLANLAPVCLLATGAALTAVLLHGLFVGAMPRATTPVPFGSFIAPAILAVWLWQMLPIAA